ncbi:MAG: leucyl/phenylalanyl-tRNA--protein transferase [Bacteroidetes bacterium]|nr:leucyl/phenylalanyl-tRNA--protein transferase [Bacteroidota bacterium]
MPVYWLSEDTLDFPHPDLANEEGILAVGGDLLPNRLITAYANGIFPWYNPGDPILWWSPDPRFVLFPDELRIAKSMRPYFNQRKFQVTFDHEFEKVIRSCQQSNRTGQQGGTWITEEMVKAYCKLHELGLAHSVEVWKEDELTGGLYGISLGKCFFGESMFAKASNASKFGFIVLVNLLEKQGFQLIDCQQNTRHLKSLGARSISRKEFLTYLQKNVSENTIKGNWGKLMPSPESAYPGFGP